MTILIGAVKKAALVCLSSFELGLLSDEEASKVREARGVR